MHPSTAGYDGVFLNNATLSSADGDILVQGRGGDTTGDFNHGVVLTGGSVIESTGTGAGAGTITIIGRGGEAGRVDRGIELNNSADLIRSVDGNISLTGTGAGNADFNEGITIFAGTIQSTGSATITLNGTGGDGTTVNIGVRLASINALITSATGAINVTGVGGAGSSTFNPGVLLEAGSKITSTGTGAAGITIDGTGGAGGGTDVGVQLQSTGTLVSTVDGNISITGQGGAGGGNSNRGIVVQTGAVVQSTGSTGDAGTITLDGTGGVGAGTDGILIQSSDTKITSSHGDIQITGTSAATGDDGVQISSSAVVSSTGTGPDAATVTIVGTSGNNSGSDGVLVSDVQVTSIDGAIELNGTATSGSDGIELSSNAVVSSTGTGGNAASILLTTSKKIRVSTASITTVDGDMTLSANQQASPTAFTSNGIELTGATLTTSGSGNVLVEGRGGTESGGTFNYGVRIESATVIESTASGAAGTISVVGRGGDADQSNRGIQITSATDIVRSVDGDIQLTGTGGTGASGDHQGIIFFAGTVRSTGSADISLTGTGGSVAGQGIYLTGAPVIEATASGDINLTGTSAGGNSGIFAANGTLGAAAGEGTMTITTDSLSLDSITSVRGDGQLRIRPQSANASIGIGGGSGTLSISDTELAKLAEGFASITIGDGTAGTGAVDVNSSVFTDPVTIVGGSVDVDGLDAGTNAVSLIARTGSVSDSGTGTDVTGSTVTIDGDLAPGTSPGVFQSSGDVTLAASGSYTVELGGTSPGTASNNHDQLDTAGTVTIGAGVSLVLSLTGGYSPTIGDQFVIINNDGADAVTGTFDGLAEGATIQFNGAAYEITYQGGTGNDVVLTLDSGIDLGDAPTAAQSGFASSYPTTVSDNGARHTTTGLLLGRNRDLDADGQPTASADGDDTNGTPDDEDGVNIRGSFNRGDAASFVDVLVTGVGGGNAFLDSWFDFNRDGDWLDSGELVYSGAVSEGFNRITFAVPADASIGETFSRFRLNSSAAGLAPTGAATDGEVEDYRVTIGSAGAWSFQGPAPVQNGQIEPDTTPDRQVTGAIHAIVAHPTNADVLYIAAVNGGIWKTTSATATNPTWLPQTDFLESLSFGALEFDPTDATRNTLLAGFASYSSFGGVSGDRAGILRTTDGGSNWFNPGSEGLSGENISGLAARGDTIVVTSSQGPGGILRSTDGGATFQEITDADFVPGANFFDLVVDESLASGQRLYAAAEDKGVYRSDDFGATWTKITGPSINAEMDTLITDTDTDNNSSNDNNNIEMTVHPTTGRLYVAVLNRSQPAGIFYTNTGHAASPTWTRMDVPILPLADPITVENVSGNGVSPIVITSTNHGLSAEETTQAALITGVTGNTAANGQFRVTVIDANTFSLQGTTGNGNYAGGGTWTRIVGANPKPKEIDEETGAQGRTHFSIRVDPNNENVLFVGGDRQESPNNAIGDSTSGGAVFRGNTSIAADPTVVPSPQWDHITHDIVTFDPAGGTANGTAPHADSREMVFDANDNLIEVDDGGIYRRTSPGDNTGDWFSLAGTLGVVEYHDIAYDTNSNLIFGGTQDNGTHQQIAAGSQIFTRIQGGDGGDVVVDTVTLAAQSQSIVYTSSQNLGSFVRRTFDAAGNQVSLVGVGLDAGSDPDVEGPFDTTVALNNIDPQRLLIGGSNGLYESTNQGDNIALVSAGIVASGSTGHAIDFGGRRSGADNLDVAYVGAGGGTVHVRTSSGSGFATTSTGGGTVRDVRMDPEDWMTAIATDTSGVFQTADAGGVWSSITGNLSSVGADVFRSLEFVSGAIDAVVLGTNAGIFASLTTSLGTWFKLGDDLPNAMVWDLDYDASDDVLVAGTMGRGAWMLNNVQFVLSGLVGQTDISIDGSGNLLIADQNDSADNLTIQSDTTNSKYVISDPHNTLTTAISGATGSGSSQVTVPFSALTGSKILVSTAGAGDSLTVDYSLGNFGKEIDYSAGNPTNYPGDSLCLVGGSLADVTVTMTGADSGTVAATGNSLLTFSDIEPITSTLAVTNLTINYSGAAETIEVNEFDVTQAITHVTSTASEDVVFNNPSGSLTINTGDGNDVINVNRLGKGFDASLTIDAQAGSDTVTLDTALNLSGGNVSISGDSVDVNQPITSQGSGAISISADRDVIIDDDVQLVTVNGGISVSANQGGSPTAGDFVGVTIDRATISSVSGDILIQGRGGDDNTGVDDHGVWIIDGSLIRSTGTGGSAGTITILGTGGANAFADGFKIEDASLITSTDGAISITGVGSATGDEGVQIFENSVISSTGIGANAASITIAGTGGGGGGGGADGVLVSDAQIMSVDGAVQITGDAATGSNDGVEIEVGALITSTGTGVDAAPITITSNKNVRVEGLSFVTSTAGAITLRANQQATPTVADFHGVELNNGFVRSATGNLLLEGRGGNSGSDNDGVRVTGGALVESTGTGSAAGTITVVGQGGDAGAGGRGFRIDTQTTVIRSVDGDISITGTAGDDLGQGSHDGIGFFGGQVRSTGIGTDAATITLNGTAGAGNGSSQGVVIDNSGTLISSVDGNISVTGQGGTGGNFNRGVSIESAAVVESTGTTSDAATIAINGTGGDGTSTDGVTIQSSNTLVTSRQGAIQITGTTPATGDEGVQISGSAVVSSTGTGTDAATITIDGTSGNNSSSDGVLISDAQVTSIDGAIELAGTATSGSDGIELSSNAVVSSTGAGGNAASILLTTSKKIRVSTASITTVDGDMTLSANQQASPTSFTSNGIELAGATLTTSGGGDVLIEGRGGDEASGTFNYGVRIESGTIVESTATGAAAGTISVVGRGGDAAQSNRGIQITSAMDIVRSIDGDIQLTGTGGTGASGDHQGIIFFAGTVRSTGDANISVTGTGGSVAGQGLYFTGDPVIEATGSGDISLAGTGAGGNSGIFAANGTLGAAAGTGTMTITTDSLSLDSITAIQGAGELRIRPQTASASIGIGGGGGTLNIGDTELGKLADGFAGITIGNDTAGTGAVDVNSSTFNDLVTIFGGSISVTGLTAGSNDVTLTARTGSISDGGDSATDVIGGAVSLNTLGGTAGDIGATGNGLSLAATTLATDSAAANADQFFSEFDSVDLLGIDAGSGTAFLTDGTFLLSGSTATGTTVDTASSATLGGSGSVGGPLNASGTIAPGSSPGILTTGNLDFRDNSTFNVEIGGVTAGSGAGNHDQVQADGTVAIGSGVTLGLSALGGFTPILGDSFTVIDNDGISDAVSGTFAGLAEGASIANFLGSGLNATISYAAGDGNDVVLRIAGITITETDGGTSVSENVTTDTVSVVLDAQPAGSVIVNIVSGDTDEVTVSPTLLTFTTGDWDTPQTVTVTGVDDTAVDGNQNVTISASASGYSNASVEATVVDNDLAAPVTTGPTGTTSDTTPTFTWNAVANATNYELWVYHANTNTHQIVYETGLTGTSFTPTTALPAGSYTFWVRAHAPDHVSSAWGVGQFNLGVVLTAPALLTPNGNTTDTTPTFSWNAVTDASTYELWVYSITTNTHQVLYQNGLTSTSYTPTAGEALPAGDYRFWVRAADSAGNHGPWSASLDFSVGSIPAVPALIGPVGLTTDTTPTFSWQDVGADRYVLWVTESASGQRVIYETNLTTNSFTPSAALASGAHTFWIQALNSVGQTNGWSARGDFTVGAVLPAPTIIGPVGNTFDTTPTFAWDAVATAVRYELSVYNQTTNTHNVIQEANLTGTSFTPSAALASGRYQYWMRTQSAEGLWGAWSVATSFSIGIPEVPVLIGPTGNTSDTTPTFSWNAATGAARYELWVYDFTTNTHQVIHETNLTGTSHTSATALILGHTYWFWVRAINSDDLAGDWGDYFEFTIQ